MNKEEHDFLEEIYKKMFDLLLKYATIQIQDYHSSYDLVQETFLTAHINIHKLILSKSPQGWIYNVLKNKILHEKRAKARFLLFIEKITIDNNSKKYNIDNYNQYLYETLKKDEYEILKYIYCDGYSMKEAAEMLGITYETCKKRVQAAKRKLLYNIQE